MSIFKRIFGPSAEDIAHMIIVETNRQRIEFPDLESLAKYYNSIDHPTPHAYSFKMILNHLIEEKDEKES